MFNQYSVFHLKYMLLQKVLRKKAYDSIHTFIFWRGWKLSLTTRNCYFPKTLRTNSSRFTVFSDTKNIIWYFLTCYMPLNWQSGQFHVFDNTKKSNCPFWSNLYMCRAHSVNLLTYSMFNYIRILKPQPLLKLYFTILLNNYY